MHIPPRSRGSLRVQARHSPIARVLLAAQRYVHTEQNSGIALLAATALALFLANSPWSGAYFGLLGTKLTIDLGVFSLSKALQLWINDALMAVFFFVVGLEIKRELTHGEIADPRRAILPVAAALGGMLVPALVYLGLNAQGAGVQGWGVPMATDIAFALGALALVGNRVPLSVRLFLLTLAVVDDIGAILVIAVFYTSQIDLVSLGAAIVLVVAIVVLQRLGMMAVGVYLVLGALLWLAVYESGIHATIAGVVLGLLTPAVAPLRAEDFRSAAPKIVQEYDAASARGDHDRAEAMLGELEELTVGMEAPIERLERIVHPWSSYLILPLFALANAGVVLSADLLGTALGSPITWGALLGLLLGKPIGVLLGVFVATRLGWAAMLPDVAWRQLLGVGLLAGIGFTMSIFVSGLAFGAPEMVDEAKIGIFVASVLAGLSGYLVLRGRAAPRTAMA